MLGHDVYGWRFDGTQSVRVLGYGPPAAVEKPLDAFLSFPGGVALNARGELVIADTGNSRLRILDASGNTIRVPAGFPPKHTGPGIPGYTEYFPYSVATTQAGQMVFSGRATNMDNRGASIASLGPNDTEIDHFGYGSVRFATGIAVLPDQSILVADESQGKVVRFSQDRRSFRTVVGNGTATFVPGAAPLNTGLAPNDLAADSDGIVYITDQRNARVYRYDSVRESITVFAGAAQGSMAEGIPANQALLFYPGGVAVSRQGDVFIADASPHN